MIGALRVRQNRVVPTPVAGAKLSVATSIQPDRSAIKPAVMEARGIRLQGEHGISRKTIAQGMPGCSGCTCMLVCALTNAYCTRDRGCQPAPGIPCALLIEGRKRIAKPRAKRAARTRRCVCSMQPSLRESGAPPSLLPLWAGLSRERFTMPQRMPGKSRVNRILSGCRDSEGAGHAIRE